MLVSLWWLITRQKCLGLITANSQDQLKDNNWAEAKRWLIKLPQFYRAMFDITSEHIYFLPTGSFVTARTASKENPEALHGLHEENMLIIADEASGIPDIVFEVGQGSLSTTGAKLILVGNPTRNSGFFYNCFSKLTDRYKTLKVNSEDIPRARGHIEDIISNYGKDSNEYRVRVLGEFPLADDDTVIPKYLLDAAAKRKVEQIPNVMPVWGLDVARFGNCKTALVKRCSNVVTDIKTWSKRDTMAVAGLVLHEYEDTPNNERPARIFVDSIGIGAGVVDRLLELGLPVVGINVGESPAGRERFINLRAELWWRAREWLEKLDTKITHDQLAIQLMSVTYTYTSNNKMRIETKEHLLDRGLPSPDVADAFILTFSGADRRKSHDRYDRIIKRAISAWTA